MTFVPPGPEDRDPSNVLIRAGYLLGMATKLPAGDDRTFLLRASRSLLAYAESLGVDVGSATTRINRQFDFGE